VAAPSAELISAIGAVVVLWAGGNQVLAGAGPLVESVAIIDEFRGVGLPGGRRSVAYRVAWRATDRTLRDAEIDPLMHQVLDVLERDHDVILRTT